MSDVFRLDGDRVLTDLADHRGVWWAYALAPLATLPGWAAWGCTFTKLGPFGEELAYTVHRTKGGLWACTCPAHKYRKDRAGQICKHISAAMGLREYLAQAASALHVFGQPR